MRKTTYFFLVSLSLVLPVWLVGHWSGVFPSPAEMAFSEWGLITLVMVLPVASAAALTLAALRAIGRDRQLSEREKRKWIEKIFFFSVIAAAVYFARRLR